MSTQPSLAYLYKIQYWTRTKLSQAFLRQLRLSKSFCLLNMYLFYLYTQTMMTLLLPVSRLGASSLACLFNCLAPAQQICLNILCITETTFTVVSYTSSAAVPIPTCISTSSQSATGNTMVAILHDYTNSQVSCHKSIQWSSATKISYAIIMC